MAPTAIGIVRVSQVRGRERDSFASPGEQRARIEAVCEQHGLRLAEVIEELDVKGATPLAKREGLRSAIEAVEAGHAGVIVVAYFDRLVHKLRIQEEILERVERAGGKVLAVDAGEVSGKSSAQWLSSTLLGAVNEYHGKVLAERVRGAQAAAVARGVPPWRHDPPGFTRNTEGVPQPDGNAVVARKAFEMRAAGKSYRECREYLRNHGINRCESSMGRLFANRAYLGELHFGDLQNLDAWPAIVEPELFAAANQGSAPRGRTAKSQMLLARLGVLHCATCDSRLVADGSGPKHKVPVYRCKNPDCERKVAISANVVDPLLVEVTQEALKDVEGRASAKSGVEAAGRRLDEAQRRLDSAIDTLEEFMDEPKAVEKVRRLRDERDEAQGALEQLGGDAIEVVQAGRDWDRFLAEEKRALIRAVIARASVAPGGMGRERVSVELVGQ
jgi:DNA invertase Pin-like site-specific DNA recombinase